MRSRVDPYKYPVLPGTDEWKKRRKTDDPWSICQIPSDILQSLTDSALVTTVLTYPPRGDFRAFDSPEEGLASMTERFNGLSELFTRPETASLLKDRLLSLDLERITVTEISNDNYGFLDFEFLTALLLHQEIISRLSDADRVSICEKALRLQAEIRNKYGPSASEFTVANLAWVLLTSGTRLPHVTTPMLGGVAVSGSAMTPEVIDILYAAGSQLLALPH